MLHSRVACFFFFNDTATTEIYTLSLHDALPILILMAKTFTTLGYAVDPRVEERLGLETGCRIGDGAPPEPAGSLGQTTAAPDGEECGVVVLGSGARGPGRPATPPRGRLDRSVPAGRHRA